MAHQIEMTPAGKGILFLAGIAAVLGVIGRFVIQPVFSAWVFFTIRHEKARMREIVEEVLQSPLLKIELGIREIRECQDAQGKELADVAGYVRRMGEEGR
jgi:hypothetical protein